MARKLSLSRIEKHHMSHTVFVTATTLSPAGRRLLEQAGCRVLFMNRAGCVEEVQAVLASEPVDAVISRTVDLPASAIAACPTLKVVSKHGVGVSNIDVRACTSRGIPVMVTPGANARSVAELTLGLMLAAARGIAHMDAEMRAGRWTRLQTGVELRGRTLGLVGYGQVARLVAAYGSALGMRVLAYDPHVRPAPDDGVAMLPDLDELLRASDVLSLHVPLTPATRAFIGAEQLARLPEGAILINTARGEVVDEAALVDALAHGRLHAAGLDTLAVEPMAQDNPLRRLPNVVLTPHVGASTPAALAAMARDAARNVLDYLARGALPEGCVVNITDLSNTHQGDKHVRQ